MNSPNAWIFLAIFALMAIQMLLSFVQVRHYQKTVKRMLGSGVIGVGQRKSGLRQGEILILSYDRKTDRVVACKTMKGYTIFAQFKDISDYVGLTLNQIRKVGIELDAKELRRYRKRHPYDATVLSKKKGALIQAVEALDLRFRREAEQSLAYGEEGAQDSSQDGVGVTVPHIA
jgi:glucitol operon activator protein